MRQGTTMVNSEPFPSSLSTEISPAHHLDNALGNRHAQSRSLNAVDGTRLFARKLVKDDLLEFPAHADSVVPDAETVVLESERAGSAAADQFVQAQADSASFRGELDGVAQDVEQDLVQAQPVRNDVRVGKLLAERELQFLFLDVCMHDGFKVREQAAQVHLFFVQGYLSAFNPAHVKHVVEQGKQVSAGDGNLFKVVLDLRLVVDV